MLEKAFLVQILLYVLTITVTLTTYPVLVYYGWPGAVLLTGYYTLPDWFGKSKAIKSANDKDPRTINLLTYNLFLRPPLVKNNASDFKEVRLAHFTQIMQNYDVIALQEVFSLGNTRQKRLINAARAHGFAYHYKSVPPPLLSWKFIDGGLLILSKFPIVATDSHLYSAGNQIDYFAAKQVIYAKLQFSDDKFLHLFTTHMQASYNENSGNTNTVNDQARTSQVQELTQFVKQKVGDCHSPVLVAGDLNINARAHKDDPYNSSQEYKQLLGTLTTMLDEHTVTDLVKESYGHHPCTYADVENIDGQIIPKETVLTNPHDHGTQECIDYMLMLNKNTVEKHLEPQNTRVEEFFLQNCNFVTQVSDHYGISTQFSC